MLQLVVTADDFGVNMERDKGILKLLGKGAVTHVSLLVNGENTINASRIFCEQYPPSTSKCRNAESSPNSLMSNGLISSRTVQFAVVEGSKTDEETTATVKCIDTRPGPPTIGLHFNITEGPPISETMRNCSALVHYDETLKSYRFNGKAPNLVTLDNLDIISSSRGKSSDIATAVKCELEAQLNAFSQLTGKGEAEGFWVDGHHHIHVTPIVNYLLQEHPKVLGTRSPRDSSLTRQGKTNPLLGSSHFQNEKDCFGPTFRAQVASKAIAYRNTSPISSTTTPTNHKLTTDYFMGLDIVGTDCSVSALHSRLCDILLLELEKKKKSTQLNLGGDKTNTVAHVEVMTHVGFPVDESTFSVEGGGGGRRRDPFYHDEFASSSDRQHELEVYESTITQ